MGGAESNADQQRGYRDLLESLSQAAPIAVTAANMEGELIFVSATTAAIHGYPSREAMLGLSAVDFLAPQERERARQNTLKTLEEGRVSGLRYKMIRRDGSTFPGELNAALMRGADGTPIGFVATVRDLTAQLEAETELVETRDTYQQLVELCPDPVVVLQEGMYRYANAAFTRCFGYTRQDIEEGLSFYALVRDRDLEEVRARYEGRLEGRTVPQTFRVDLVSKLGQTIPCETSATLIQHRGRPADLVVIRDITDRERSRRALVEHAKELGKANARLAEANERLADVNAQLEKLGKAKDQFMATVSHELRTPLVTGLGYLDLLLGGNLGELSAQAQERVHVARRNLLRLAGLIDGILDYHALVTDGARVQDSSRPFALDRLCVETARDFRIRTQCAEDHLALSLPDPLPLASGSPEMLRRVLDNLLDNAHHHGGADCHIELSVELEDAHHIRITVADDGPGIPAAAQEHIFDPFVKAGQNTTGTGLGLSIVSQLLEAHGTEPRLRSEPGATHLSFTLPAVEGESIDEKATRPDTGTETMEHLSGRLLVVDDDADTREFLELLLRGAGFEVETAYSAEVALERLSGELPDLMLVDVTLPGMSGIEMCAQVKRDERTAGVPVCMFTARAEEPARAQAREARSDAYLVKPVPPEILLSTIRELLS